MAQTALEMPWRSAYIVPENERRNVAGMLDPVEIDDDYGTRLLSDNQEREQYIAKRAIVLSAGLVAEDLHAGLTLDDYEELVRMSGAGADMNGCFQVYTVHNGATDHMNDSKYLVWMTNVALSAKHLMVTYRNSVLEIAHHLYINSTITPDQVAELH